MGFTVFISHRHQDARIAKTVHDVLKEHWFLQDHDVHVSSLPGAGRPGNDLNNFLRDALNITDLFILVFTEPDEDWSYCMWELGVVTGRDTKETRVVVLNCANSLPRVRVANLEVDAREADSVQNFADLFFSKPDWLIRSEETRSEEKRLLGVLSDINPEGVAARSLEMFNALQDVLPQAKPSFTPRLEHLEFRLEAEFAEKVRVLRREADNNFPSDKKLNKELRNKALTLVEENVKVVPDSTNPLAVQAARRFGFDEIPNGTSLKELFGKWDQYYESSHGKAPTKKLKQWQEDLKSDFSRAVAGSISKPSEHAMGSIRDSDTTKVQPVIVGLRRSGDGAVDFSVYFFRVVQPKEKRPKPAKSKPKNQK